MERKAKYQFKFLGTVFSFTNKKKAAQFIRQVQRSNTAIFIDSLQSVLNAARTGKPGVRRRRKPTDS
jgi:hypothetical protein